MEVNNLTETETKITKRKSSVLFDVNLIPKIQDYRDLIGLIVDDLRRQSKIYSFEFIGKRLHTTKSYIKLVIDKKRHMSIDKVGEFCDYFQLHDVEKQLLLFLYLRDTSTHPKVHEFFKTVAASYARFVNANSNELLKTGFKETTISGTNDHLRMAILSCYALPDFKADAKWLHSKLGGDKIYSEQQVEVALQEIQADPELVKIFSDPSLRNEYLLTDTLPFDLADFSRFKQGFHRAEIALDQIGKNSLHRPNRFLLFCLPLDREATVELLQVYDEFNNRIKEIAKKSKTPERVVMISNNLFNIVEV